LKKKHPTIAALAKLTKKEQQQLRKRTEKQTAPLKRLLDDKLPPKLQDTLRGAFLHAFEAVFSHGGAIIDKSFSVEKRQTEYQVHRYTAALQPTKKNLRAFSRKAQQIRRGNTVLSGTAGFAMGLFGIGLPDIPVFVGFLLKNVYETALANGFGYKTPGEQYFILLLIEAALSCGSAAETSEALVNAWIEAHCSIPAAKQTPQVFREQLKQTAYTLADAVLYVKFIQGIPIVGAAGGISDAVCVSQIGSYAALKYERRRLTQITPKTTEKQ